MMQGYLCLLFINYMLSYSRMLVKLGQLRPRFINHRNFLLLLSLIVGTISGLASVVLKISVSYMEHKADKLNDAMHSNLLTAFLPLVGTGLSMFILLKFYKGKLNRGVGHIVQSIRTNKSRIEKRHITGHILTSSLTVAFGGSVGLEAPIVSTGAAIGSNTATDLRLSPKDTTLLLACGTASGIAAIFNSPIAGILFVLEIFLLDFSIPFFIPLLISTATATVISQILYPQKFVFLLIEGWNVKALPFYVLLGIICGFVSVYVTLMVELVEGYFAPKNLSWKTWLMAGIPLCLLILLLPRLYGEGYHTITELLHGRTEILTVHSAAWLPANKTTAIIVMSIALIFFKAFSAPLTVCAGGNGGVFGPALFIGGLVGFLFAFIINTTGLFPLNTANFIIAAMAGVLAGVMHAPLMSIFLLAEITGGYTLFVPLMIVVAISYFLTRKYIKQSLYHKHLYENSILLNEEFMEDWDHF